MCLWKINSNGGVHIDNAALGSVQGLSFERCRYSRCVRRRSPAKEWLPSQLDVMSRLRPRLGLGLLCLLHLLQLWWCGLAARCPRWLGFGHGVRLLPAHRKQGAVSGLKRNRRSAPSYQRGANSSVAEVAFSSQSREQELSLGQGAGLEHDGATISRARGMGGTWRLWPCLPRTCSLARAPDG